MVATSSAAAKMDDAPRASGPALAEPTAAEPALAGSESWTASSSDPRMTGPSAREAPSTSGSETDGQKGDERPRSLQAKSCKGCLYFSNMRAARGGKPLCIGLSRKEGEQEVRGAEVGKERQARQEFKYACVGYALWEDGASASGAGAGAHMPAVLCTGLEFIATKDAQEASTPSPPGGTSEGDRPKANPFSTPHPASTFPTEDFRLRFQRSAGRLAEHTFNNMQKIGSKVKESVSNLLSQTKDRPKS